MIEQRVQYKLRHTAAIAAIVSNRIYPVQLPQEFTLPAITYQLISNQRIHAIDGPIGVAIPRVQIDCYADTYSEVKTLADKVRITFDGFRGSIATETDIGGIYLESEQDIYSADTEIYRVSMDFMIPHGESLT